MRRAGSCLSPADTAGDPGGPTRGLKPLAESQLADSPRAVGVEAGGTQPGCLAPRLMLRSIFKAFKEARGVSPMAFVKRVRLTQARRMLQAPAEVTSVIDVAFQCGFLNPGHFARDYRLAFGELPSQTLRNIKRGARQPG